MITPPWAATLSQSEYLLTLYFLVVAALALLAGFLRTLTTQSEVGSRFRPAGIARLSITAVAFTSYLLIVLTFVFGYDHTAAGWVPNANSVFVFTLRYTDWSVTVPLLTFELLAVCSVVGTSLRRTQFIAGGSAFLMIFFGFLGAIEIEGGTSRAQLIVWGIVSAAFWALTNIVLIRCVRRSKGAVTPQAALLLKNAAILLLSGWVVYPLVYLIQIFGDGGGWATTMQVALCVADIVVKIGFGTLIQRVAKLRTAEDVRAGDDIHPESIWISQVKQSDAGQAREVYLAEGASVHPRQARPPMSAAVPAERDDPDEGGL